MNIWGYDIKEIEVVIL